MLELRIHGRGGTGVVTLADLLSKAALAAGKEAQALPFFGVERRGAVIRACFRISDTPILQRSMSYEPHIIALMHENMLPHARNEGFNEAEDGTAIIVNSSAPVDAKGEQWLVDAEKIARDHGLIFGWDAYVNVPMAGAIAKVIGIPLDALETAIQAVFKGKNSKANLAAARDAYTQIVKVKGGSAA
ncbi:MAG: 2-oxoacid:acceptor oxidoreductase family protein [Oscillospiraceae bacterium]|jgi:pyruvate ferredoxin oxidoreductase gamma subunit|nr:2-oxoacid:acceptor oxidoreductase family protein [Oscillospiraceae bacterium]